MFKTLNLIQAIFGAAILFLGHSASCQTKNVYQSISVAQGLSAGMVFDILQDREGFIWVATKSGLDRYDGYGFKVFTNDPYNSNSLSGNIVVKLFEDSKGRIWIGTDDAGLNVYDKKNGKFYRIANKIGDSGSLSGNQIRLIEELPDGRVLVAPFGAGFNIIKLGDDFFEKGAAPVITRMTLPGEEWVYGMGKDKNGTMWIGGMDGAVYRFDPLKNSFHRLNNGQLLNSGYITRDSSILINSYLFLSDGKDIFPLFDPAKTPAGNIIFRPRKKPWGNPHRELYFYDVSKWEPGKAVKWTEQLPAQTRLLYPFIIDRSGMIWSGTVGYGLRKYNTAISKFKLQVPGFSVRWIVPVSPNDIFLGNYGYGWARLKNDLIDNDPFHKISTVTQIDNFIISKTGDYWIKSDKTGFLNYNFSTGKLRQYPQINDDSSRGSKQPMLEDSKGNIWFPGLGGHFTILNTATGKIDSFSINTDPLKSVLPTAICTALYQDKQGIYWIGTQGGFAKVVFNDKVNATPLVTWYYNSITTRNSLNYNNVSCFMDDPAAPDRYLWICTKGGGLNRLNKITGDFFHLTSKDGLPDDVVYGILPDDAGNIWGSTNNGIFCLLANTTNDNTHWVFRNFTKAYGLQDDEFNTGAYTKLQNGNLAFGGVNGLNIFNPKEVLRKGFTPNVFITNILINNQPVLPGDKTNVLKNNIEQTKAITLSYLQDILTLEFSSLDFTAPEQNKYRYQLVGIDKGWVESGTRRIATYLHLPAGTYTFKVQGSNSQGSWSNRIAELKIKVLPPWWFTGVAYGCYFILLGLGINTYVKFMNNRNRLKVQLNFEQLETKRIKELDLAKTQFYTNISHEFRTPLTVILGMAQKIADSSPVHLKDETEMIIRNGQSLLKLVNEMLDLSKLQSGKMALNTDKGDLIVFLRYVVEAFHSFSENQKKQLHFLSELESYSTEYDAEKMRQIISNLLSNALKFTPKGGNIYISVNSKEYPEKENTTLFVIKIKDTGIGIPEDKLPFIFDRFYQADISNTRTTQGTGIGLSLTRELVNLMNGEISVKSPPPGVKTGTEFTVELPLKKLPASDIVVEQSYFNEIEENIFLNGNNTQKKSNGTPITNDKRPLILLVEDNADVAAYTAFCLPDYRLAMAKDGMDGFEQAVEIIPDLIISDVMMPLMDGFELLRKIKTNEYTSHIPVILLTAKADRESKMEGISEGADAYLEKPFNNEELQIRVRKLLELRKNLQMFYLKKAGLLNTLLSENAVNKAVEKLESEIEDKFVIKVREVIEAHISDAEFNLEQLCGELFMSHSKLHRKLGALTGCSPNKFIRIVRLQKAKELLKDGEISISSIAIDCGFSDPGYFSRVFKQELGVTPNEWRTDIKE